MNAYIPNIDNHSCFYRKIIIKVLHFTATNVCSGRTCAAYATCNNYQCVCDTGYVGNGYRKCTRTFRFVDISYSTDYVNCPPLKEKKR